MAACAEMNVALTPAFKPLALSRIKGAQAFVDRVSAEVVKSEASPPERSLPTGGRARSSSSFKIVQILVVICFEIHFVNP